MKYRLTRDSVDVTNLPDEIVEQICSYVSPVELCLSGWNVVSKGFGKMLREVYSKNRILDTVSGQSHEFFDQFLLPQAEDNEVLARKLGIIIRNIFPHVTTLTVSAATFCAVLRHIEMHEPILLLPKLRSLHILLGDGCGTLTISHSFNDFALVRTFANELKSVELSVMLSSDSEKLITCCSFRLLVRFLMEITGSAGTWSLCLKDKTDRAQGWFCPSELSYYRAIAFISYVRAMLELGLSLHTLQLIDELKMSPYMIVMKKRRRFLYMYDEYKQCQNLIICYDIGIVAPSFPHDEGYFQLQRVEIGASHVLYKNDFLKYLSEAPNITVLRILLPCHWTERVKRCTFGCFRNADFACFMEYGWASLPYYLPRAALIFS